MRTTLTIDDKTFSLLKEAANQSGKPFKQVINEVLLLGLDQLDKPKSQPYHLKAASLGKARHGIDLNKALYLADYLEDLEQGCTVYSADNDFKRFPGLQHVNPLDD